MSIRLMTEAWKSGLPIGQKMVLLALCDNANDQGECYPSVSMLVEKCSMSERSVFNHINLLEKIGAVSRQNRNGRSTVYTINPCKFCTPANSAPLQILHPTPATVAPPPLQPLHPTPATVAPITVIEPSIEPSVIQSARKRAPAQQAAQCPSDVDQQVFADWLQVRKAKRAGPVTETGMAGLRAEALAAGLSLNDALAYCCLSGWQGFKADWFLQRSGAVAGSGRQGYQPHKSARQALVEGAAAAIFEGATHV